MFCIQMLNKGFQCKNCGSTLLPFLLDFWIGVIVNSVEIAGKTVHPILSLIDSIRIDHWHNHECKQLPKKVCSWIVREAEKVEHAYKGM